MGRIEKILEFLKNTPHDSFLKHALALEYVKIGEETKAQQQFEEILEREPNYVGSYYHLAKLFERIGQTEKAIAVYEKGMEEAKKAADNHALSELRSAWEDLTY